MNPFLLKLPRIHKLKNELKNLPENPGVYIFWNESTVLYIGKAINLRRRLDSYFSLNLSAKTSKMVSQSTLISFVKVNSELEALLLEASLVRRLSPRYNIALKDDKHPLYIKITKEEYPKVLTARKVDQGDAKAFYGPFPSSRTLYSVLRMIRRIFPYADHKIGKRACIYRHMGLCNPCPSEIVKVKSHETRKLLRSRYLENIRLITKILSGKVNSVVADLNKKMGLAAKEERFEEAAFVRDQIKKLNYIVTPKIPSEYFLQNPNLFEDIRNKEKQELKKVLFSYFPQLLVLHPPSQKTLDVSPRMNAKSFPLRRDFAPDEARYRTVLGEASGEDTPSISSRELHRIECFDVAHLAGSFPTASMVTFVNGEPDKFLYRHFRIKKAKGGDDVSSLKEVAKRRSKYLNAWGAPDLIIVDGGRAQVAAFLEIFSEFGIPVIGLAKRFESLIIPKRDGDKTRFSQIKVRKGPALNMLQRIRDEAHRFARRYHHKLIQKALLSA